MRCKLTIGSSSLFLSELMVLHSGEIAFLFFSRPCSLRRRRRLFLRPVLFSAVYMWEFSACSTNDSYIDKKTWVDTFEQLIGRQDLLFALCLEQILLSLLSPPLSLSLCCISDQRASLGAQRHCLSFCMHWQEMQTTLLQKENECDRECSTTESTGDAMARASRLRAVNGDRAMLFTLWRIDRCTEHERWPLTFIKVLSRVKRCELNRVGTSATRLEWPEKSPLRSLPREFDLLNHIWSWVEVRRSVKRSTSLKVGDDLQLHSLNVPYLTCKWIAIYSSGELHDASILPGQLYSSCNITYAQWLTLPEHRFLPARSR